MSPVVNDMLTKDKAFYRTLIALAVPIALQNLVTFCVNLADSVMVGSLGDAAVSGMYMGNQIQTLLQVFSGGIEGAILVLAAQYWGQRDTGAIRKIGAIGIRLSVIVGGVLTVLCAIMPDRIIGLFTHDPDTVRTGAEYLGIVCFSYIFFCLTQSLIATMRSVEIARIGLYVSTCSLVTNVALNYVLIFGKLGFPELGIRGAAIATVISRFLELAIVAGWTHLHKERHPFIRGAFRSIYIPGKLFKSVVLKGMPLLVNEFLWSTGVAILNQCYSTCGLDVVPAMNIASTINNLASVAFLSLGNSVGIIMGQMLGSGRSEPEIRDSNRKLMVVAVGSGLLFGAVMAAFAVPFPRIYNTTDEVRHLATLLILVCALAMPVHSFNNATYFTLRSGGQAFVTFLFDSCYMWVVCVPLAFCLSRFTDLPIMPLYLLCQLTDMAKIILGSIMLKQGKWIQNLTV